ncbi:SRPBCC family protein [Jatrophihabitans sp.]|uniref:SRPBCC family protein n=1 Tax=Jatrophihabitans sp. TaxID=1932789 RepID=UPI0030C7792B|nr:polyketide cyclase [Jatrophihabitans sp.]
MGNYVFRSTWHLDASPEAVYTALADVERYPLWWPQIRAGRRLDEASGEITCRSLLPYDLTFVATRVVEDPVGHVLRATMAGDLNGTSEWRVSRAAGRTEAVFDEDVTVGNSMVRRAGFAARPALRFNHDLMMRAGERGLRRYLRAAESGFSKTDARP